MNDITVKNLTVSFDGKTVLDNFSYVFPAGHTTCIMGASGCGKTTLLNALLGFVKPDTGEISDMPKKKACVFQEDRLCEEFSAVSNAFQRRMRKICFPCSESMTSKRRCMIFRAG